MRRLIIVEESEKKSIEQFLHNYIRYMIGSSTYRILHGFDLIKEVNWLYSSRPDYLFVLDFLSNDINNQDGDNRLFALQECGVKHIICTGSLSRPLTEKEKIILSSQKFNRMIQIINNRDDIIMDNMFQAICAFDNNEISFVKSVQQNIPVHIFQKDCAGC